MILLSFGRWSSASGPLFIRKRIYWNGTKWTPFVRVFWRYCKENSLDEAASAATATMYRLGYRWHGVAAIKTKGKNDSPLKRPGDDLRFVLAQLAFLEDGLTDEDVVWPIRVSFALQAVKKRGLKIEPWPNRPPEGNP